MAFLHRMNRSRLKHLSQQFKRHYIQIPFDSSPKCTPSSSRSYAVENPCWGFCRGTTEFCYNVRFFAAPVQKKVIKEGEYKGPRLNDKITAPYVRLVIGDEHSVVSLGEASKQAAKLELDLVEVNRKADPPVCKIMNYHKEKYLREMKAKELAKSKVGLRKGSFKEVRFSKKAEDKDLKMKADTVLRLIERGYRVKCTALGSNKKGSDPGDEDEKDHSLGTLLSRITSSFEDVVVVESEPRVESHQAYVIVRHAKFGLLKNRGAKKLKNISKVANGSEGHAVFEDDDAESGVETDNDYDTGVETDNDYDTEEEDIPDENLVNDRRAGSFIDSPKGFGSVFNFSDGANVPYANPSKDGSGIPVSGRPSSTIQPSVAAENRYNKRNEPRNQFPPTTPVANGTDRRGQHRIEPQFSNQRRQAQAPINAGPFVGERRQAESDTSFRNFRQPSNETVNQTSPSVSSNTPSSSYGIFSSSNPSPPRKPGGEPEIDKVAEGNRYSSQRPSFDGSQRMRFNNGGQGGRGVFRRDGRNDPN